MPVLYPPQRATAREALFHIFAKLRLILGLLFLTILPTTPAFAQIEQIEPAGEPAAGSPDVVDPADPTAVDTEPAPPLPDPDSSADIQTIEVIGQRFEKARNSLSPSTGSSQYTLDAQAIENLPQGDNTPFNEVLLQYPGVANDSFGQLHIRGDHNDIQYRFNGIILPEGASGFAQVLDPRFAKSITLNTGALPAEYGLRTAGVIDIVTKDNLNGGNIDVYGGSHDTLNPSIQFGKTAGAFSGYVTGQYLHSNLGVENPTPKSNAIHDWTEQGKGFAYGSWQIDPHLKLSALGGVTSTRLEIPNNPGQSADPGFSAALGMMPSDFDSAKLNERQYERNIYGLLALQGVTVGELAYRLAVFDRQSTVEFKPDPLGDLAFNGDASRIKRKARALGTQGDLSVPLGSANTFSTGFSVTTEDDRADNTSQVFPTDSSGNISGGPETITDNNPKNGNTIVSLYAQDQWDLTDGLTLNYGVRYDRLRAFVSAQQLSPRLGIVDKLGTDTTLHAGYARYFTPPPNELVASSSIARFANTTNSPEVTTNSPIQAERSHYFDLGVTHQLTPAISLGLDAYYRYARELLDEGQFGQALIFTPFNYQQGHVYGLEFSSTYHQGNWSAYFNAARSTAQGTRINSGEFNFGPDELTYISSHYIFLDHDQGLTMSGGASYLWSGTTLGMEATYGSGLRRTADSVGGNPAVPNGAKLIPNVQIDLSAARSVLISEGFGKLDLRLAVLNLLDRTNQIRDGTGVGVGAPQFGPRTAVYFGIAKPFGGT